MYVSAEEARSDVVLTIAAVVLGRYLFELVAQLPGYPSPLGHLGTALLIVWQAIMTILAAWWLARYRRDVPAAFALGPQDRGSVTTGIVLALPLVVAHLLPAVFSGSPSSVLLGLGGRFTESQPAVGGFVLDLDWIWLALSILVLVVGNWLVTAFVAVRSRDAFRSPDMDLTELVRTFGMGGVAVSFVLGLLVTVRGALSIGNAMLATGTLLVVVLLTDRQVPARTTTTRASVLGPVIGIAVLHVLAAGGLFSGSLLFGLYFGSLAVTITLCAATMAHLRQGWALAILVTASVVYPMPILAQPLPCSLVLCF